MCGTNCDGRIYTGYVPLQMSSFRGGEVFVTPTFGGSAHYNCFSGPSHVLRCVVLNGGLRCFRKLTHLDPVLLFSYVPQILSHLSPPGHIFGLCYFSCSRRHFLLWRHFWASSVRTFRWSGLRLCFRISNFSVRQRLHDLPPTL